MNMKSAAILETFLVGFLVLAVCSASDCSNGKDACDNGLHDDRAWTREDTEDGLVPLLHMTNNFLYTVQPRDLTKLKKIWTTPINEMNEDFFMKTWKDWAWYLSGYIACILAGFLFFIIMPIVGLCFCCCRCCGKCGSRYNDSDLKTGNCTRVTCCVLLFIFTTFMFAAVVCAFVLNGMIAAEVRDGGFTDDVVESFSNLESYRDKALADIRTYGLDKFNDTKVEVYNRLDRTPQDTVDKIENITNVGPAKQALISFANNLYNLSESMDYMRMASKELDYKLKLLPGYLNKFKADLNNSLHSVNCSEGKLTLNHRQLCEKALNNSWLGVSNLTTSVNYSSVYNLDIATRAVKLAMEANFTDKVNKISEYSDKIKQDIRNKTEQKINESKIEVDKVQTKLQDEYNFLTNYTDLLDIPAAKKNLTEFQKDYVEPYGYLTFYIILGLIAYLLIITVCLYIGLACGALCQRPKGPSGGCCDTSCGARFLMAAVYLGFIFFWLYMLLTMTFFAAGGPLHTELCIHAEKLETSPVVAQLEEKFRTEMKNLSIQHTYGHCSKDMAIYTALDLEKIVNITEYLDIDKTDIPSFIDSIKNLTFDINNITIVSEKLRNSIDLLDSPLKKIEFSTYWREMNKPFVDTDLTSLIRNLNKLQNYTSDNFAKEVEKLQRVENDTNELQYLKQNLSNAVNIAENIVKSADLKAILGNLTEGQNRINNNGSAAVKQVITKEAEVVLQILRAALEQVDDDVRNKAGKCKPLYTAIHGTIRAACVYFLNSFNSLWFCFGWFLFFLLPSIIFAVKLAKLYHIPRSQLTALGIVSADTLKRQKANLGQRKMEIPRPSLGVQGHRNSADVEHYADCYQYSPDDVQLNKLDRRSFYPGWGSENPTFVADYSREAMHSPRSPGPAFGVPVMPHMGRMVPGTFKFDVDQPESPPPYSAKDIKKNEKYSK